MKPVLAADERYTRIHLKGGAIPLDITEERAGRTGRKEGELSEGGIGPGKEQHLPAPASRKCKRNARLLRAARV